jgi:hypothetical protein
MSINNNMSPANAMLDGITARLCAEYTAMEAALVERAVIASWWMFEHEGDDNARARATEWYARAALTASAEGEPVEPA